jgi:hypothetical protein
VGNRKKNEKKEGQRLRVRVKVREVEKRGKVGGEMGKKDLGGDEDFKSEVLQKRFCSFVQERFCRFWEKSRNHGSS